MDMKGHIPCFDIGALNIPPPPKLIQSFISKIKGGVFLVFYAYFRLGKVKFSLGLPRRVSIRPTGARHKLRYVKVGFAPKLGLEENKK